MRHRLLRTLLAALPALLLAVSALRAEPLRFVSVEPAGPGEWVVGIAGGAGGRAPAQLAFRVDGAAVPVKAEGADRVRLQGVPAGARRLEVLPAGAKAPAVAVNLSGQAKEVEVDLGALVPADTKWTPVLGDAPVAPGGGPGRLRWTLPPWSTSIVVARMGPQP